MFELKMDYSMTFPGNRKSKTEENDLSDVSCLFSLGPPYNHYIYDNHIYVGDV